jgi:hypothetical protein
MAEYADDQDDPRDDQGAGVPVPEVWAHLGTQAEGHAPEAVRRL